MDIIGEITKTCKFRKFEIYFTLLLDFLNFFYASCFFLLVVVIPLQLITIIYCLRVVPWPCDVAKSLFYDNTLEEHVQHVFFQYKKYIILIIPSIFSFYGKWQSFPLSFRWQEKNGQRIMDHRSIDLREINDEIFPNLHSNLLLTKGNTEDMS